jgi:hypothetical protein
MFPLVAAAMEYDPHLRTSVSYLEVLSRNPNGPSCILGLNFGGGQIAAFVQKLFRVRLLRDEMIRPLLDDTGAAALNSVYNYLQTSVCSEVCVSIFLSICIYMFSVILLSILFCIIIIVCISVFIPCTKSLFISTPLLTGLTRHGVYGKFVAID